MVKSKDDPDQNDVEEFYDSHSDIEELINDAETHKNDPVTDEEEFSFLFRPLFRSYKG